MTQLGEIIRAARRKRYLTVQELAKQLKITSGYVSRIEVRGEIPTNEMLVQLVKTLRLNMKEISEAMKADVLDKTEIDLDRRLEKLLVLYRRSP